MSKLLHNNTILNFQNKLHKTANFYYFREYKNNLTFSRNNITL